MRSAFTLIELLVATAIGVAMVALVAGTLVHTSRTAVVAGELLAMHDNAQAVNRVLARACEAQVPATAWHLVGDAGPDGAWGTGDERCSLTFMASQGDRNERDGGFTAADQVPLNWYRLSWAGPNAAGTGSYLRWSVTSGQRRSLEWSPTVSGPRHWQDPASPTNKFGYRITIQPEPRRDRRRPLDDNDLRHMEGIAPARYAGLGEGGTVPLAGDEVDLERNASALVHASTTVEDVIVGWIDRGGWETRFDPQLGIRRRDDAGAPAPFPAGAPWLSATRVSLDGVFTDARAHTLAAAGGEPADPRDAADARPAVLRLAFTLRRPPPPGARARDPIEQRFAFTFPLQPGLSRPAHDWPRGTP